MDAKDCERRTLCHLAAGDQNSLDLALKPFLAQDGPSSNSSCQSTVARHRTHRHLVELGRSRGLPLVVPERYGSGIRTLADPRESASASSTKGLSGPRPALLSSGTKERHHAWLGRGRALGSSSGRGMRAGPPCLLLAEPSLDLGPRFGRGLD